MLDRRGMETFINPVTKENHFDALRAYLERIQNNPKYDFMRGNLERAADLGPDHLVWTTNAQASTTWTLVTVLTAAPKGGRPAQVSSQRPGEFTIKPSKGRTLRLRWKGKGRSDVHIDLNPYRATAATVRAQKMTQ